VICPPDWIAKVSNDLRRVSESLISISRRLHEYTRKLGDAVEGRFAPEASDPRVRLLNEALQISNMADLQLSRIGVELIRITEDWQNQSSSFFAGNADEPKELAIGGTSLGQEDDEPATLYEITRELNSTHEFDSVLQLVMGRVIRFVNAERGFLMLINPETEEPEFTIARDEHSQPIARSAFTISQHTVKRVIGTNEPILINDTQADEALKKQESILAHNIRSIMCAPLLVRGDCIGAVYVDRRFTRTLFEPRHRELLLAFCNQAAIAIDNARLFADLTKTMKRVREDKQYMDNIFGSIVNGVVTTDSAGMITTFNAAASVILSLHPDQIMGRHYTEAFASLPQVGLVPLLNQAHTQHEHGTLVNETIECTIPERRGIVSLNCYVSSLRDTQGTHIGIALVIDDQTSIKQTKKQAEEIRRLFEQYVHPNVVRQLIQDPQALNLGGETKEISVVFADIRGYTSLGESMPPDKVMDLINGYLKIMCDAIWEEEGTLTAFQGDALMAIFNAPLPQSMHALHAVRAAWKMRAAVLNYQRSLPKELHVSFGFGVNTGLATVGNVGAKGRLQNYTAIGDVINVAARLQSNATNNDIYINDSTYMQVKPYLQVSPFFPLNVKGKAVPLTVRRLLGPA
jgi:PAS domain S-box-containing protein